MLVGLNRQDAKNAKRGAGKEREGGGASESSESSESNESNFSTTSILSRHAPSLRQAGRSPSPFGGCTASLCRGGGRGGSVQSLRGGAVASEYRLQGMLIYSPR